MRKSALVLSGYILGVTIASALFNMITTIIASVLLAIILYLLFGNRKYLFIGIAVILAFCIGAVSFSVSKTERDEFLNWSDGKFLTIYAKVVQMPEKNGDYYNTVVKAETINYIDETVSCKYNLVIYSKDKPAYTYCDKVMLSGFIERPEKAKYESGFDAETYLRTDNIVGSMFLSGKHIGRIGAELNFYDRLKGIGYEISNKIDIYVRGQAKEVLKGIAVGDTTGFSEELKDAFSKSGISHITAVSGMNVTMLVGFIMLLFSFIGGPLKLRAAISIIIVFAYMIVTGLSASVIRSSVMVIMGLLAIITDRKDDEITSIVISAAIILMLNPYSIYDAGFLLSFSAVIGIRYLSSKLIPVMRRFLPKLPADIMSVTICAQIATLPVMAYMFNKISTVAIITNLIVVPFIEMLFIGTFVMLAIGVLLPGIAAGIGSLLGYITDGIIAVSMFFADLPFSSIIIRTPNLIFLFTYVIILCIIYLSFKNKRIYKLLTLLGAIMSVLCVVVSIISANRFEICFINVGQGDSIYVSYPTGENFLIDTGKNKYESSAYLKNKGISHIDKVILTHIDNDHSGGLEGILSEISVGEIILPYIKDTETVQFGKTLCALGYDVRFANHLSDIDVKNGKLDFIWPGGEEVYRDWLNNNSIVLNISYLDKKFLLMGDAGIEAEKHILSSDENIDADIIKVGHHGSDTSTSEEFIKSVTPEYAVISVGENIYNHPDKMVIKTLMENGCKILRTDIDGNISFYITPDGKMKIKTE